MLIPKTEKEKVLVCNAALEHYVCGSFSDVYSVCETGEDEETVTKYKEAVIALSDCVIDAMIDYMGKL